MLHLSVHKPRLPLRVTVLDVGQGLSVVVESQTKLMVYDVGAAYGESFDMGSAVVAPFVINRGFKQIDRVVVSHGDNDHFGGFKGLSHNLPVKKAFLTPGFLVKLSRINHLREKRVIVMDQNVGIGQLKIQRLKLNEFILIFYCQQGIALVEQWKE